MRVDHAADAIYLNLTDRPIKDSEEVADGIVVDYDAEGRIVGIEILDAKQVLAAGKMPKLAVENLPLVAA